MIRDLVGVDFQPAEDLPSDDIGNGFDNIADVLSISPVLMERYLTTQLAYLLQKLRSIPEADRTLTTGRHIRYLKDTPQ